MEAVLSIAEVRHGPNDQLFHPVWGSGFGAEDEAPSGRPENSIQYFFSVADSRLHPVVHRLRAEHEAPGGVGQYVSAVNAVVTSTIAPVVVMQKTAIPRELHHAIARQSQRKQGTKGLTPTISGPWEHGCKAAPIQCTTEK